MAIRNDGGGDDSEDDDDIVIGVGDNFRKHIEALKRACVLEVGHAGYISTPASILSGETPPAFEENDDEEEEVEEEDDDKLFLSIKSKYGSFGYGDSPWFGKRAAAAMGDKKSDNALSEAEEEGDEEEDDEELLRSVEKLYKTGLGGGGQRECLPIVPIVPSLPSLPEVLSPQLNETRDTNEGLTAEKKSHPSPSPQASPGCEPDGNVGGDDGCFSPPTTSETGVEQGEEIGSSIASFLPGNWNETDGDVLYGDASPAGPLEGVSVEHGCNTLSATPEETNIYRHPESAPGLTDALKKNRQCQKTLRNALNQIEAKQKENAVLQKRVRSLVDFEKYCNRRFAGFFTDQPNPSVKLIAAKTPASQNNSSDASIKTVNDLQTCGPPENPDVEIYKKLQKKVAFTFPCRRWSNDERIELAKGLKQQVYEVLVLQAMDALSNADALDEEFNSLDDHMSKIGGKEFSPQQIRDAVPGIDWAEVARVYVVGRTPEECRTRWINHEDSLINKGQWKKMEDKKLLSIAQQHDFCSWEKIAEQLGTNRTPAECLTRYQRSLNASIMRSNWTPEEDNRLRAAVGESGENDWSAVSACLEGRNNSQCLMRWYKVLHPTNKKRGRWSVEEDKRLKWAVSVYGPKKWKQIAEHVPGRTDLQCRERWCNVLDPSIKLGEWTEDEDRILEESVARHGPHRWAAVANDLKIRTDNQCCRRWKFLHPEDQPEFQRTVHIRRTALVGNFQGRKKERPRLGPQDFISKGTDFQLPPKKPARKRQVTDKQRGEPMTSGGDMVANAARERRAARILKRKLARARKASSDGAQKIASAPDVPTNTEFMDVIDPNDIFSELRPGTVNTKLGNIYRSSERAKRKRLPVSDPLDHCNRSEKRTRKMPSWIADASYPSNKSDKGRKRKAGHIANPIDPSRRSKLKVTRLNQSLPVSPSQDTSREVQSGGPEIVLFLDLVQSLESYCKCLFAEEKNRVERVSNATRTQEPAEMIADVVDKFLPVRNSETNSSQKGMSMPDQSNRDFSHEDEEVASATRAVLSWPFLRGVQELLSQGSTYVGSLGGADLGSQGTIDFGSQGKTGSSSQGRTCVGSQGNTNVGSPGMTDLGSETYLGSHGPTDVGSQGLADLGVQARIGLGSQEITNLGSQERTDFESPGALVSKSQGMKDLGSQVRTDLGPQGTTYFGSHGSSRTADKVGTNNGDRGSVSSAAVRKSKRISLRSRGGAPLVSHEVTDEGPQGLTYFLSQGVTCLGSGSSIQNTLKNGTNKGDIGSVPSAAVKKPRSKRMRGALPLKKSDEVSKMISRISKPGLSADQKRSG